jgi:general stress protein 26
MFMKAEELVKRYLPQIKIMQLATVVNDRPYVCTVHYYSDSDLNIYWCSLLTRRHSEEIKRNPQIAAYVLVHENTPDENYVIGITILGEAELVGNSIDPKIVATYASKLEKGSDFEIDVLKPDFPHKFYCLRPKKIILFDNKNFSGNPRQEYELS